MSLLPLKSCFLLDSYSSLGCSQFLCCTFVVVDLLFIVAPIVCRGSVFGPCFGIHYFLSF